MLRSRFLWIVLGSVLVAATTLLAGCSLDSGNPIASTAGDADGVVALDETGDHSQFVSDSQAPARVLAKPVGKDKKGSGGDEKVRYEKKTGPAHYQFGSRR